ncbi:MAG: hypothetical protein KDK70_02450 [Myxococcales bacterium]|nr:hypothetical protein [Myxococcales bacterium]
MEWRCESGSPGAPGGRTSLRDRPTSGDRGGRALLCAACGLPVTSERARIEVAGAHRHTFVNPHGLVFEIGCFDRAPGCAAVGPAQAFFSWFPGHAWRVGVCRGCGAHLGWRYDDPAGFHGLVLDRLREGDAEDDDPS